MKKISLTITSLIILICLLSCNSIETTDNKPTDDEKDITEISYTKLVTKASDYNFPTKSRYRNVDYGLYYKAKLYNGFGYEGGQLYNISFIYCGTEEWAAYVPWGDVIPRSGFWKGQISMDELVTYNIFVDKDKNVEIEIDITFLICESQPEIKRTEKSAFDEIFKFIDKSLSENHSKSKVFSFQLDTLIDDGKPIVKHHKKISYSTMNDSVLVIKTKEVNNKIDTNYINNKFDYFSIEERGNIPDSFRVKIRDEKLNIDPFINRRKNNRENY